MQWTYIHTCMSQMLHGGKPWDMKQSYMYFGPWLMNYIFLVHQAWCANTLSWTKTHNGCSIQCRSYALVNAYPLTGMPHDDESVLVGSWKAQNCMSCASVYTFAHTHTHTHTHTQVTSVWNKDILMTYMHVCRYTYEYRPSTEECSCRVQFSRLQSQSR